MNKPIPAIFSIIALSLAALACSIGSTASDSPTDPNAVATSVAATVQVELAGGIPTSSAPTVSPDDAAADLLPHAVYFLSDTSGTMQLWRLERDSITLQQLTFEATPVDDFAISPVTEEIAYLTNNQIITIRIDGRERALIVDGGPVAETEQYYRYEKIYSLAWSPNGRTLAYSRGGLALYSVLKGTSRVVLVNETNDVGGGILIAEKLYFPERWSPDGSKLLVTQAFYEGSTLGVWDMATESYAQLQSDFMACCFTSWSPDSRTIWVASPYIGLIDPGLWRFDASSGIQTELLAAQAADGTFNFASFPFEVGTDLLYFFANTPTFPDGNVPLTLVRAPLGDINSRTALRPETWILNDALWAPDGSLVLGIQPTPTEFGTSYPAGTLVLIPADGSPSRPLASSAYNPAWGP
ncbi:MAG: hypothetical protein EPO32_04625 [Anaerolineae bacterium]|nr:MAG: hypothetical protein EPO32_04625 [Anaerolineae bacterium]